MNSPAQRQDILTLINEAETAGATRQQACELIGLCPRTISRWQEQAQSIDKRTLREFTPPNKLTDIEQAELFEGSLCWETR